MKSIFVFIIIIIYFLICTGQTIEHKHNVKNYYHPLLEKYDVIFYFIDVKATNTSKYIEGKTTIKAKVLSNFFDTMLLQLHYSLNVDSVKFYNNLCLFQHTPNNELFIKLPEILELNDTFSVCVYYKGTSEGNGIRNGQAFGEKVTWTLTEPYGALDWFPCKQIVTDKADSAYIYITCKNTLKAGSNGVLKKIDTLTNNYVKYCWQTKFPIAYYLISLTVSDYMIYNIYAFPENLSNDSILITNYIYNNSNFFNYYKTKIDSSKQCMELLCKLYGLYPFYSEKYGHITAPIGGGMEHQTLTTISTFSLELIIHEMAHQWFGDYVTCSNWQDIWINEGFATYSYYLGLENFYSSEACKNWLSETFNWIMIEPGGSVYVPFDELNNVTRIFDYRLTYLKGAALVHMIRYIINNDSIFFSLLRGFLNQYAFSNASGDDFKNFLNYHTNYNFNNFFDEWYYGQGYPIISLYWNKVNDTVYFTLLQQTSLPSITPFFHIPVEVKFSGFDKDTIIRVNHNYNGELFSAYVPFDFYDVVIDPNNHIVNKVGEVSQSINSLENLYRIYPNPSSEYIYLSANKNKIDDVKIYDIFGNLVYQSKYSDCINIKKFPNGIYIIDINNLKTKFIKN
ncbi:MAG: M1 family aminopeptidase [Bacteroidales bacterium]|nr:M1 family aminopeptidase [Bacteroidales bacterium]